MSEYIGTFGVTVSAEEIKQRLDLYEPIIDYLKVVYNRPRPFQTAAAYGIPHYPRLKTDASDSSYPGGHTLLSLFFRHIYMQSHPELARPLMQFVLDVSKTREEGGVHYPSDNLFSMRVYKHIKPWMNATHNFYIKGT
jgi:membrane-associated phospholipid phosphatase